MENVGTKSLSLIWGLQILRIRILPEKSHYKKTDVEPKIGFDLALRDKFTND